MSIIIDIPQVQLDLIYYKIVLGKFMHRSWTNVLKGFIINKSIILNHPFFVNLEEDNLPIGKPINRNKLLIYLLNLL
jgi:hypothetical protein